MGQLFESELVPLFDAGSLAYLELTGVEGQVGSEEHLRDVVELAVITLLRVAPIYQGSANGSSSTTVMSAVQRQKSRACETGPDETAGWPAVRWRRLVLSGSFQFLPTRTSEFDRLAIPLDRDRLARDLLREFVDSLTKAAGAEKAADLIRQIGERTGAQAGTYYRAALKTLSLTRPQIAAVFLDLKRRIGGDSYIVEQSDEKIVLCDRACPLGRKVMDRPALCMMTSGVFGAIASQNTGYAKVELKQTIAERHEECRVVVYLKPTAEAQRAAGREYRRADQRGS